METTHYIISIGCEFYSYLYKAALCVLLIAKTAFKFFFLDPLGEVKDGVVIIEDYQYDCVRWAGLVIGLAYWECEIFTYSSDKCNLKISIQLIGSRCWLQGMLDWRPNLGFKEWLWDWMDTVVGIGRILITFWRYDVWLFSIRSTWVTNTQ